MFTLYNNYIRQKWHPAACVSTNKCVGIGIVECGYCILELKCSINSKWQFLYCATVVFSERSEKSFYLRSYFKLH